MEYRTIKGEVSATYEIQRSTFICRLSHIDSYQEGVDYAKSIAKKHSDATHNCYAILLKNGQQKFFDDGEPQGTAGIPILQAIKNQELFDVVAVVTRYFGGIKLGANGLITSYAKAVTEAIDKALVVTNKYSVIGKICLNYTEHQAFLKQIREIEHVIIATQYDQEVTLKFAVPQGHKEEIESKNAVLTGGQKQIKWQESAYMTY